VLLPWQQQHWQRFQAMYAINKLPHGLLFYGPEGLGKYHFSQQLILSLLCANPSDSGFACGNCTDCRLMANSGHPNYFAMTLGEGEKVLKVDSVREALAFINRKVDGKRIVHIYPAECLNLAAANALLKSLEEPGEELYFFLVSHYVDKLLPTIRSRCHQALFTPNFQQAQEWLQSKVPDIATIDLCVKLADGAPLRAEAMATAEYAQRRRDTVQSFIALIKGVQGPLAIAEQWHSTIESVVMMWLLSLLLDIARYKLTTVEKLLINVDFLDEIKELADILTLPQLQLLQNKLIKMTNLLSQPNNSNLQLLLEHCLLECRELIELQ
jgi:DNA polymerase-3 subunit delta'